MLKIQEIRELIKLIDESSITEFNFEQSGAKVSLKKQVDNHVTVTNQPQLQTKVIQEKEQVEPEVTVNRVSEVPATKEVKASVVQQGETAQRENLVAIKSPMVGTFYSAPSPESAPYVATGDKVKQESVVCIVEAMKLMNEIEAEVNGEIKEILVENGQLVEYGQELFLVKPE